MDGDSKGVRFVLCPKCGNLLPEMPDYSIYRCGGCDATLKAKKALARDARSKGSERATSSGKGSRENAVKIVTGSSSKMENEDIVHEPYQGVDRWTNASEDDQNIKVHEQLQYVSNFLKDQDGNLTGRIDQDIDTERHESDHSSKNRCSTEGYSHSHRRLDAGNRWLPRFSSSSTEPGRFPKHAYLDAGPSSSRPFSAHDWNGSVNSSFGSGLDRCNRVENELLLRLDELKNDISRAMARLDRRLFPGRPHNEYVKHDSQNVPNYGTDMDNFYRRRQYQQRHPTNIPDDFLQKALPFHQNPIRRPWHGDPDRRPYGYSPPQNVDFYELPFGPSVNLHAGKVVSNGQMNPSFDDRRNHARIRSVANRRKPANLDMEIDNLVHSRHEAVGVSWGKKKHCFPIGIGSPFIVCPKCSVLLRFPKRFRTNGRLKQNIRCCTCSAVICIEAENQKIVASVARESSPPDNDNQYSEKPDRIILSSQSVLNDMNVQNDYDTSNDRSLSASEPEEKQNLSLPSVSSEHSDVYTPPAPAQEHLKFSTCPPDIVENVNESRSLDQAKMYLPNAANESEVSFNVFLNTGLPQQGSPSVSSSNQAMAKIGGTSLLVKIVKKSFWHSSRENRETYRCEVSVNGHSIPQRAVKKAAVLAGPILPGDYWYDFRAGFWGVMGGACLGILPPFIKQFNYPMPANCAGGSTSIFVNGRELHWKDLELLAKRGLPTVRNRSYKVEFLGRVLDDKSGQELRNLGKLAPTVERMNRGFGMHVPEITLTTDGSFNL